MVRVAFRKSSQPSRLIRLRLTLILLAVATAAGLLALTSHGALADRSVNWSRYDVSLNLQNDGTLHVVENFDVDFNGGPFHFGYATIPLENLSDINNISMREETGGQARTYKFVDSSDYDQAPGTFTTERTSTDITINWGFESTTNETRTFILEYDVEGALRVYPDHQPPVEQIVWTAIDDDVTSVGPVGKSTVTMTLPKPVDTSQVMVNGQDPSETSKYTKDGQTYSWTKTDLNTGDQFVVGLQFPAIVDASPPSWQIAADQRAADNARQDQHNAILNLFFLGIGLLAAVGGGAGIYGLWYTKGRDPHTGLVADFIPSPPDDLPPGAAGTLIDETADQADVVATLVDLGRRGALKIDESGATTEYGGRDFQLTLLQPESKLSSFETELIAAIFGPSPKAGATVKMSAVKSQFDSAQGEIKADLYNELVQRKYFMRSPEETRRNWKLLGGVALAVDLGLCVILSAAAGGAVLWSLPIFVIAALAIAILVIAKAMPRKTPEGAEAAAKWNAFKRYLDDIEKYEKLDEAKGIFDKYLPFAVAFGLEHSWVSKFASVNAPVPQWYGGTLNPGGYPGGYSRRRGGPVVIIPGAFGGGPGSGGGGGHDVDLPDIQDVSDSAAGGLQGMSDGLSDLFNTAGKIFSGFNSHGGGGGGWGGGGSFGGGGGFSGGSSGGGGRGFG
ncbi:MAG: DUF2207 family protein [Thermomicrobiales bacterium]